MPEPLPPQRSRPELPPDLPDYGIFPRVPADGTDWIHPDDIDLIQGQIPSDKIFCRYRYEDGYYHFRFGATRFRLRPCLWLPVKIEGIEIGDRVETIGVGLQIEGIVTEVIGMHYRTRERQIVYRLANNPLSERLYTADQLRLLEEKAQLHERDTYTRVPQDIGDEEPYQLQEMSEPVAGGLGGFDLTALVAGDALAAGDSEVIMDRETDHSTDEQGDGDYYRQDQ